MYTEKELVSFGNYLLSKERKQNVKPQDQDEVWHSDFENWKPKPKNKTMKTLSILIILTICLLGITTQQASNEVIISQSIGALIPCTLFIWLIQTKRI